MVGTESIEFTFNTTNDPFNVESNQLIVSMWQEAFGDQVFHTVINRTVKFPDASVAAEPITTYAGTSAGAEAYRQLARELVAFVLGGCGIER